MLRKIMCALLVVFLLLGLSALAFAEGEYAIRVDGRAPEGGEILLDMSRTGSVNLSATEPTAWTSSSKTRVSISEQGEMTLLSPGFVTVTGVSQSGARAQVRFRLIRGVTAIDLTGPDLVASGKAITLRAAALPNDATNRTVTWVSSDPAVATVNAYGRVTAARGLTEKRTVTITAAARDGSGVTAEKQITVYPTAASVTIYLNGQPVNGQTIPVDIATDPNVRLTARVEPAAAAQEITWSTSSRLVAPVAGDGLVTGNRRGTVTITATAADGSRVRGTVRLSFSVLSKSISIEGADRVAAGQRTRLKAVVSPENTTNKRVTWQSSDPSVATVNPYGWVSGVRGLAEVRTVTITALAADGSGAVGSKQVTVFPVAASVTILLNGQPVNGQTIPVDIAADPNVRLTARVEPAAAGQEIIWSTSSKGVGPVENGLVTGLRRGSVAITAMAADGSKVRANVRVSFTVLAKGISLEGEDRVASGRRTQLKAVVTPADAANKRVTWVSSDPSVATVNPYGWVYAARGLSEVRTVTITATAADGSGVVGTKQVTVFPVAASVTICHKGQPVNGQTLYVDLAGDPTAQLTARVEPAAASQEIIWSTSSKITAPVTADGLVRALRKGTVTIFAIAADGSGVRGSVRVCGTVLSKSVEVTGPASVNAGKSVQLRANVLPGDTGNKKVTWVSSDPSVATVNGSGLVTGQPVTSKRSVTITAIAQDGGSQGSHTLSVLPRAIAIDVRRDGANIPNVIFISSAAPGTRIKLSASVYPSEAAQGVTWDSAKPGVARVEGDGTLVSGGEGFTMVTAKATDGSGVTRSFYVAVADLSTLPYYLEVDKANQVVRVYERGDGSYTKLIRRMICSSGTSITQCYNGLYRTPGSRGVMVRAENPIFYMPYATKINGPYFFHGVPTMGPYPDKVRADYYNKLGTKASAGCIRLLCADAKWIYENVPARTFVLVMEGVRTESEYGAVYAPPIHGTWDPTDDNPNNPYYDPSYTSLIG